MRRHHAISGHNLNRSNFTGHYQSIQSGLPLRLRLLFYHRGQQRGRLVQVAILHCQVFPLLLAHALDDVLRQTTHPLLDRTV